MAHSAQAVINVSPAAKLAMGYAAVWGMVVGGAAAAFHGYSLSIVIAQAAFTGVSFVLGIVGGSLFYWTVQPASDARYSPFMFWLDVRRGVIDNPTA